MALKSSSSSTSEAASRATSVPLLPIATPIALTVAAGALSNGSHSLFAVYAGNSLNAPSQSANVTQIVGNAPQVVSVTPNGNVPTLAGNQRSRVVSLQVVFDQPVQLDLGALALALHTNGVAFAGEAHPTGFGTLPAGLAISTTDNVAWTISFGHQSLLCCRRLARRMTCLF